MSLLNIGGDSNDKIYRYKRESIQIIARICTNFMIYVINVLMID